MNNQHSSNQYGKNRNGNKYGGECGIKAYNLRSRKHDTQSDVEEVDFEASAINAIESDVNMNSNYGKEDQQLQYKKKNCGGGLYCIKTHLTNSYSVFGDQDSRFSENSLLHHGYIPYLYIYHISLIVIPTGLVGNTRIETST